MESKLQAKRVLEIGSFCGVGISPASTIAGVSGFNHQKYELFLGFKDAFLGFKVFFGGFNHETFNSTVGLSKVGCSKVDFLVQAVQG